MVENRRILPNYPQSIPCEDVQKIRSPVQRVAFNIELVEEENARSDSIQCNEKMSGMKKRQALVSYLPVSQPNSTGMLLAGEAVGVMRPQSSWRYVRDIDPHV